MSKLANKLYFKTLVARDKVLRLLKNEQGETNLVAIILILAVVIALVVLFRDKLKAIFDQIWDAIGGDVGEALK